MIAATDEDAIGRLDVYDRLPVHQWGTGRVTMLGDAAHPMTLNVGQGACMAIEDALVLSRSLRENGDVAEALRRYEDRRRDRTAETTRLSWTLGRFASWRHPAATRVRDVWMRIGFPLFASPTTKRFCAYEV